jgi:hypothetical protein
VTKWVTSSAGCGARQQMPVDATGQVGITIVLLTGLSVYPRNESSRRWQISATDRLVAAGRDRGNVKTTEGRYGARRNASLQQTRRQFVFWYQVPNQIDGHAAVRNHGDRTGLIQQTSDEGLEPISGLTG